jgi:lysyl-tRNA synthetase class 2
MSIDTSGWQPTASVAALRLRARLNTCIRGFFEARGVLEVETPILSQAGNTEPRIESFEAGWTGPSHAGERRRFLRTSPEHALKRLLASGVGDCYELGRVFRRHNPEFTMLEWYRVGWDHHRLMDEVAVLVEAALALVGASCRVRRSSYRDLFGAALGIDPFTAPVAELASALDGHGVAADGLRRDDWLDLLLTHRLQPAFPADQLLLLHGFPPSQCALARIVDQGLGPEAQRFEAFLGPLELANGYHELTDAAEQRARFAADNAERCARGQAQVPVDERLLAALQHGMPACAGVALGVDRLLSAMLGAASIDDVVALPFARA